MINELYMKNALRCQLRAGVKCCKLCPYRKNDDACDMEKLASDSLEYIKDMEHSCFELQNEIKELFEQLD